MIKPLFNYLLATERLFSRYLLLCALITAPALTYSAPTATTQTTDPESITTSSSHQTANTTVSEDAPPPFFVKRRAVMTAVRNKDWDTAIAAARAFFDFTIPRGRPYEQLEACSLLVQLLHQQGDYAQARQVVDEMIYVTQDQNTLGGSLPEQMSDLIQQGMKEALMADDHAALLRYQQMQRSDAKTYPALWHWELEKRQIHYQPAQITLPFVKGRWVLRHIQETDQRSRPTEIDYSYMTHDGSNIQTYISLSYNDAEQTPQEKRDELQHSKDMLLEISSISADAAMAEQVPDLPYKDAVQIKYATKEKSNGQDLQRIHWKAIRGHWLLRIEAQFLEKDAAVASAQLPVLIQQIIDWPDATELPGGQDFEARYTELYPVAANLDQWPQAATSAQAELPNAIFPRDIAYLQSIIGIAAFQAGDMSQAGKALNIALGAWPYVHYVSQSRYGAALYEDALEYAAETAAQAGNEDQAIQLTHQYVSSTGKTDVDWQLHDSTLVHRRSKQVLPLRAAGFHIRPIDRHRFYYIDLNTNQQLGLTVNMSIPATEDEQEQMLTQVLERQFQLDVQAATRMTYAPDSQTQPGKQTQGTKWVFDVTQQASGFANSASTEAPIQRVIFWIMDHGTTRSVLRASISDSAQERRADQLADALPW